MNNFLNTPEARIEARNQNQNQINNSVKGTMQRVRNTKVTYEDRYQY